jgi:hypothetical protein
METFSFCRRSQLGISAVIAEWRRIEEANSQLPRRLGVPAGGTRSRRLGA